MFEPLVAESDRRRIGAGAGGEQDAGAIVPRSRGHLEQQGVPFGDEGRCYRRGKIFLLYPLHQEPAQR